MTYFTPKPFRQEAPLGERLRQIRLQKNQKIEDLGRFLGIRREYLEAIEDNRYDQLPPGLYGKSFLKKYAIHLGLKTKDINHEIERLATENKPDNPFSQKVVKRHRFIIFPKLIKNAFFTIAIATCLLYLLVYAKKIIQPPELIITRPEDNILIKESSYLVTGQASAEAEIKINEVIVLNNQEGNFSQTVNLKQGINTLTISAQKKYGRPRVEVRQILVEQ